MGRYKKVLQAFVCCCIVCLGASAQLTTKVGGMVVKNGGHIHIAGLEMRPSADLAINDVSIDFTSTPASGDNGSGIAKVYRFSTPLNYQGLLRLYYQTNELNGNTEADLVLANKPSSTQDYVLAQTSTVNTADRTVESVFNGIALFNLTATGKLVTLPLQLLNFNASAEGGRARIFWTATAENGISAYRVLRSSDDKDFSLLAQVEWKATGATSNDYVVYDRKPLLGQNYYKLQELDRQGTLTDLGIRNVDFRMNGDLKISVYPNPSRNRFNVASQISGEALVTTITGQVVKRIQLVNGTNVIDGSSWPKGIYILRSGNSTIKLIRD